LTDGFAIVGSDAGNCPVVDHYALAMTLQLNSRIKFDVRAAG
jgi:hypothetical protein